MHKESFEPSASAFRQAPSSQFIGRGVTLVMAAGFVVANIYYSQPSRQVGHPVRPRRAQSGTQLHFSRGARELARDRRKAR
jgi:hypothetical protein